MSWVMARNGIAHRKKNSILKILSLVISIFSFLILSGHYLSLTIPGIKTYLAIAFAFVMILYVYSGHAKYRINNHLKVFLLLFVLSVVLSGIVNIEFRSLLSYAGYFSIIIISGCIVSALDFAEFRRIYTYVICTIAIISLLGSILRVSGVELAPFGYVVNVNGATYANGYIFTYNTALYASYRNYGVFWEPGVYSTALLMGIFFQLYENKPSKIVVVLLSVAIFTTQSAAGYVLLIPVLLALAVRRNATSLKSVILRIFLIFAAIFLVLFWDHILDLLFKNLPWLASKLFSDSGVLSLHTDRTSSPYVCLDIFSRYPLFGRGLVGFNLEYQATMGAYSTESLTSTSFYMIAAFGILGISYTVGWFYSIIMQKGFSITTKVLSFVTILMIINKEPHSTMLLTWCTLLYLLNRDNSFDYIKPVDARGIMYE